MSMEIFTALKRSNTFTTKDKEEVTMSYLPSPKYVIEGQDDMSDLVILTMGTYKPSRSGKPLRNPKEKKHENYWPNLEERILWAKRKPGGYDIIKPFAWFTQEEYDHFRENMPEEDSARNRLFVIMESLLLSGKKFSLELATKIVKIKGIDSFLTASDKMEVEEIVQKALLGKIPFNVLRAAVSRASLSRSSEWRSVIVKLPFSHPPKHVLDMPRFKEGLEKTHAGMDEVKKVFIEEAAYQSLGINSHSTICLVGAPGVGKTSIAQSFANLLGREVFTIPLGSSGFDSTFLTGFQPSWSGAAPGAIIKGIITCERTDPVIILDEIDKMGEGTKTGNATGPLLSLLDPSQRAGFVDNFLGIPYDLSRVTFIATANYPDRIAPELLDRLRVIDVPSYSLGQKLHIASKHMLPKICAEAGFVPQEIGINDDLIKKVITDYTSEAGCRSLQKSLDSLVRQTVVRSLDARHIVPVRNDDLKELLGPSPNFGRKANQVGRVMWLSTSSSGGCLSFVEALLTGNHSFERVSFASKENRLLGEIIWKDLMKSGAQKALSIVTHNKQKYRINDVQKVLGSHIHIDGDVSVEDIHSLTAPVCIALISAANKIPPPQNCAIAGEVGLFGDISPVLNVRDKVFAAVREGITHVILPAGNERDVLVIPEEDRPEVKFSYVHHLDDAIRMMLGDDFFGDGERVKEKNNVKTLFAPQPR